jgi:hypothetical protein
MSKACHNQQRQAGVMKKAPELVPSENQRPAGGFSNVIPQKHETQGKPVKTKVTKTAKPDFVKSILNRLKTLILRSGVSNVMA